MIRIFISIFLFASSVDAFTKTYADMFNIVYRNKLYYSSYIFLKKSIKKNNRINQQKIDKVLDIIHPSVFIHDYELDTFVDKETSIDYAVGVRRFFLNDFKIAKKKFLSITRRSPMYVESNYFLGLISLTENKVKKASKYFKRCIRNTTRKKQSNLKPESYVFTFKNRCIQQLARINFSLKKYTKTVKILNYVQKDDYIWPRFLLDKAWSYYWMGQNERALGSVITYKAPLLKRFMVPEANYLRGLIYYEMCYFEKAENIYKEFVKTTWRFRNRAKKMSRNKLLKLMTKKKEPQNEGDKFLYYYLKGFKQDIRYITYNESRKQLSSEIKRLSRIKSLKQAQIFLDSLYYYNKAIKKDFKDFLKNLSEDYYKQIVMMRNAFVKLNLMVSLKKRKEIAKRNKDRFEDELKELSLSEIPNVDDKFIWDFRGGFWADELGDYAVALKNRCNV